MLLIIKYRRYIFAMSKQLVTSALKMRTKYKCPVKEKVHWYPSHMAKGMHQMQAKLKSMDCVIEVHDARIPFSGRNLMFKQTLTALRPHVVVYNKTDLADDAYLEAIKQKLKGEQGVSEVLFTNCKDQGNVGVRSVVRTVVDLIRNSERYCRTESQEYQVMIIGIPNVGKSSLINILRSIYLKRGKASRVGAMPGVTKSVLEKIKISYNPLVFLRDTPGIMMPRVTSEEAGMRLALCATMKDHLIGEEYLADYLLYWLNKHENFSYVEFLGLNSPTDNITEVLFHTAINLRKTIRMRGADGSYVLKPDLRAAAQYMIKAFREVQFGRVVLDDDFINPLLNT